MSFIYGLCEPGTSNVRYVGVTESLRVRYVAHIADQGDSAKARWIAGLRSSSSCGPRMIVLEECAPSERAQRERRHIKRLLDRGVPLVNGTYGGGGGAYEPRLYTNNAGRVCRCIPTH